MRGRTYEAGKYDCIVVGAGHAGVKRRWRPPEMGAKTLTSRLNLI